MSYDKVIDSAPLDSAMTATANAIRGKTGDTAKITWDASRGFASAIAAISGGAQFATGTFYASANGGVYRVPITISGLGFTPSKVLIRVQNSSINQSEVGGSEFDGFPLMVLYNPSENTNTGYPTSTTMLELYDDEYYDEEEDVTYHDYYAGVVNIANAIKITPTSDGFTVGSYSSSYKLCTDKFYDYIAWA